MGANLNHLPKPERTFTKKEVRKLLNSLAKILENKAALAIHNETNISLLFPLGVEEYLEEFDYKFWIKEKLK